MKLTEKIFMALAGLALVMKFNLIPGHSLLLLISLGVLISIYFYFGFLFFNNIKLRKIFKSESYKGISGLRLTYAIFAGLSISMLIVGILFKFMRWPGSSINIIGGLVASTFILVLAIIKYVSNKEIMYKLIIVRFSAFIIIGTFLLFISSNEIVRFQYRNHPMYVKACVEYENNPENEELRVKERLEWDRMFMSKEEFERYHPEAN